MDNNPSRVAVQLIIGPQHRVRPFICASLHRLLNACGGCAACKACRMITDMRSYQVHWLLPAAHGYTCEQIDEALAPLRLALDFDERRFLIIEGAESLLSSSAHRLLKVLEEPPHGWHIILTAERRYDLLPTLRSRCVETVVDGDSNALGGASVLLQWLENPRPEVWPTIGAELESLPKTVIETISLLNRFIAYWHRQWQVAQDGRSFLLFELFSQAQQIVPSHGGTVGFWRVIMLKIAHILQF